MYQYKRLLKNMIDPMLATTTPAAAMKRKSESCICNNMCQPMHQDTTAFKISSIAVTGDVALCYTTRAHLGSLVYLRAIYTESAV